MQTIVENTIMWPAGSLSWDLGDIPRYPADLLYFVLNYGTVNKIFAPFGGVLGILDDGSVAHFYLSYDEFKARKDLKSNDILFQPYNIEEKKHIYNDAVLPVLQAVFEHEDPVQKIGNSALFWSDFIEFFTNLLWCSRLKMPFVIDMEALQIMKVEIRNKLIEDKLVRDPRPINELITIIECYKETDLAYYEPIESKIGSALDIWFQIKRTSNFIKTAEEKRRIGSLLRLRDVQTQIARISQGVKRGINKNPTIGSLVRLGNAAISIFTEPTIKFSSSIMKSFLDIILSEPYVPPIYSLHKLEYLYNSKYHKE